MLIVSPVVMTTGCGGVETINEKALKDYRTGLRSYLKILQKEIEREEEFDSLFFGVRFKMTANMFYDHCNEMHKQGIFDGNYNHEVIVDLTEGFKRPVNLIFYPRFNEPFIELVSARFTYTNASVFNKAHGSGILIKELVREMMKWYGGRDFIRMPPKNHFDMPSYVKLDGNRKITLMQNESLTEVVAIYEDLKPLY